MDQDSDQVQDFLQLQKSEQLATPAEIIEEVDPNKVFLKDFQIIKELGKGGFGSVFLVHVTDSVKIKIQNSQKKLHQYLPDNMALKKIYMSGAISPQKIQSVNQEAQFLRNLENKHFIKSFFSFFDFETVNVRYVGETKPSVENRLTFCILMENAQKGDLQGLIQKHKKMNMLIAEDKIWNLAKQITEGLCYLHSKSIIHRDIKPQNILLMQNDDVKIGDLGISRAVQGGQLQVSKIGTPIYISPEVLRKQPFDYKIDIWALGCLMHYLACLEPAFSNQIAEKSPRNHYNLSKKQKLEDLILNASPKMIPDFYSNNLKIIISRLLDKNPQNRPSSEELLKIIQNEHRASSSFENQIFGGSGLGIMTARQSKPHVKSEYIQRTQKQQFKLPEMSNSDNSQISKKEIAQTQIKPLKLPGLSISTQASTQNEIKQKSNKNDKVYKKETPKSKPKIDFKILNLASLNNRVEAKFSRQSSIISDNKPILQDQFYSSYCPKQIIEGSVELSRSSSAEEAALKQEEKKKRYGEQSERVSQLQIVMTPADISKTIDPKNYDNPFKSHFLQKLENPVKQKFQSPKQIEAPVSNFSSRKFSSSRKPLYGQTMRNLTENNTKNRILNNSLNKNQLYKDRKFIKKSNQFAISNITNHTNQRDLLEQLLITPISPENSKYYVSISNVTRNNHSPMAAQRNTDDRKFEMTTATPVSFLADRTPQKNGYFRISKN